MKLFEEYTNSRKDYLRWKRKNVTIRGIKTAGQENQGSAMLGKGLYTAFLSNKDLAKQYGQVYFVVNAIPKKPKIFNNLNEWEIWQQTVLYKDYMKDGFPDSREFFKHTTIEDEVQKLGYDGVVIKGREMVNYSPEGVLYFTNERQLENYYYDIILFR